MVSSNEKTIFIGGMREGTSERRLRKAFEDCGKIVEIRAKQRFAFIEFSRRKEAFKAVDQMDGERIKGKKITVEMSRNKKGKRKSKCRNNNRKRGRLCNESSSEGDEHLRRKRRRYSSSSQDQNDSEERSFKKEGYKPIKSKIFDSKRRRKYSSSSSSKSSSSISSSSSQKSSRSSSLSCRSKSMKNREEHSNKQKNNYFKENLNSNNEKSKDSLECLTKNNSDKCNLNSNDNIKNESAKIQNKNEDNFLQIKINRKLENSKNESDIISKSEDLIKNNWIDVVINNIQSEKDERQIIERMSELEKTRDYSKSLCSPEKMKLRDSLSSSSSENIFKRNNRQNKKVRIQDQGNYESSSSSSSLSWKDENSNLKKSPESCRFLTVQKESTLNLRDD